MFESIRTKKREAERHRAEQIAEVGSRLTVSTGTDSRPKPPPPLAASTGAVFAVVGAICCFAGAINAGVGLGILSMSCYADAILGRVGRQVDHRVTGTHGDVVEYDRLHGRF